MYAKFVDIFVLFSIIFILFPLLPFQRFLSKFFYPLVFNTTLEIKKQTLPTKADKRLNNHVANSGPNKQVIRLLLNKQVLFFIINRHLPSLRLGYFETENQ